MERNESPYSIPSHPRPRPLSSPRIAVPFVRDAEKWNGEPVSFVHSFIRRRQLRFCCDYSNSGYSYVYNIHPPPPPPQFTLLENGGDHSFNFYRLHFHHSSSHTHILFKNELKHLIFQIARGGRLSPLKTTYCDWMCFILFSVVIPSSSILHILYNTTRHFHPPLHLNPTMQQYNKKSVTTNGIFNLNFAIYFTPTRYVLPPEFVGETCHIVLRYCHFFLSLATRQSSPDSSGSQQMLHRYCWMDEEEEERDRE